MEKYGYEPATPQDLEKRAVESDKCPTCGKPLKGAPPTCPTCGSKPFEKRDPHGKKEE